MVEFLYSGKISSTLPSLNKQVILNMQELLGFSNIFDTTDIYPDDLEIEKSVLIEDGKDTFEISNHILENIHDLEEEFDIHTHDISLKPSKVETKNSDTLFIAQKNVSQTHSNFFKNAEEYADSSTECQREPLDIDIK